MGKRIRLHQAEVISLSYLSLGVLWIFLSDKVTTYIFSDDIISMTKFQLSKGIFFVIATGVYIYFLTKSLFDRVNHRKKELELLFTNPNLGILKVDEEGYFTEVSPNIEKLTGYHPNELLGKHLNHHTPEHRKEKDLENLLHIRNSTHQDGFIFTKHLLSKSGAEIIIKGYGARIETKSPSKKEYIVAFQNITDHVNFLKKLEDHNKQLRELASEQSHLVRAPLARILGITGLFEEGHELTDQERNALLRNLKVSGEELDQALKDISQKMLFSGE